MNISAVAIKNPIPIIILFVFIAIAGIYGFHNLGIISFPNIDIPTVTISIDLPGATPEQMENQVTNMVEDSIAHISGVKHITSTISNENSITSVEFDLNRNLNDAIAEVRDDIYKIKSQFPPGINEPQISKVTVASRAILTYQISGSMDLTDLSWYVDNQISQLLSTIPGVIKLTRHGGVEREIQILLAPNKLITTGSTINNISNQFHTVYQDLSGGNIEIGGREFIIQAKSKINTVDDIANLNIPLGNSRYIQLGQISKVKDTYAGIRQMAFLNGKPVVTFDIYPAKGAGEIETANVVRKEIKRYLMLHPEIKMQEINNSVDTIQEIYSSSMHAIYEGAILAIIVIWLFLRDFRATLIAAIALPLSIIPTFYIMYLLGYSLNVVTLLALTLVIGALVDDAIVEIENIICHLTNKPVTAMQAAISAVTEISTAVMATSVTLIAMLIPTAFMSGIPGRIFEQFGWTAAIAVLISLAVARLLTPILAAYLLFKPKKTSNSGKLIHYYLSLVNWSLEHPKKVLLFTSGFLLMSLLMIKFIPATYFPPPNNNQIIFQVKLSPGSTVQDTLKVLQKAYQLTYSVPEIRNIYATIGDGVQNNNINSSSNSKVNTGMITFNLIDRCQRKLSQAELEYTLANTLKQIPGIQIYTANEGLGVEYKLVLAGKDKELLRQVVKTIQHRLLQKNLSSNSSNENLNAPELMVDIDYNKAARLGVTPKNISDVIRVATSGDYTQNLAKLNLTDRQIPIRIKLDPTFNHSIDDILNLTVSGNNGTAPLSSLAKIYITSGPSEIKHYDRNQSITLSIDLHKQAISDIDEKVKAIPLMHKLPGGIHQIPSGDLEQIQEMYQNFYFAILTGILLTYSVLTLLFKNFKHPLTILSGLPLAIIGAILILVLLRYSISMPTLIGLLMLMGIVSKNSILLVDCMLLELHKSNCTRNQAIINACIKRSRPIIMTTVAMIVGMLPMALGLEGDSSFRSPLALTVIGGLFSATILSLLITPVIFSIIDDLKCKILVK